MRSSSDPRNTSSGDGRLAASLRLFCSTSFCFTYLDETATGHQKQEHFYSEMSKVQGAA
jgi:hypothetical protein